MRSKISFENRTRRIKKVLFVYVVVQLLVMTGMLIYQILDFTPAETNRQTEHIYEIEFVTFWSVVTGIDFIMMITIIILKKKKKIQLGKMDDLLKFLAMITCAFTSMGSIFLAGDQQVIGGAIIAVVSIILTTTQFYIDKIGNDKVKTTQANIVKQLQKDIKKSKQSYEKIEEKINESLDSK